MNFGNYFQEFDVSGANLTHLMHSLVRKYNKKNHIVNNREKGMKTMPGLRGWDRI